jgi:hypothetical protein
MQKLPSRPFAEVCHEDGKDRGILGLNKFFDGDGDGVAQELS